MKIEPLQQPTEDSCTATCLAMITGKSIEYAMDVFHGPFRRFEKSAAELLREQGIMVTRYFTDDSNGVVPGGVYLLTVPSLNIQGKIHHVVLDWSDDEEGPVLLDPNLGKKGKKYYINKYPKDLTDNEVAFSGCGWIVDYRVHTQHQSEEP